MHCGFSTPQGGDPFGPGGAAEGKDTWPKFPVQTTFGLAHSVHREISRKSRRLMNVVGIRGVSTWPCTALNTPGKSVSVDLHLQASGGAREGLLCVASCCFSPKM